MEHNFTETQLLEILKQHEPWLDENKVDNRGIGWDKGGRLSIKILDTGIPKAVQDAIYSRFKGVPIAIEPTGGGIRKQST